MICTSRYKYNPTCVNGSTSVFKLKLIIPESNLVEFNLPICLSAYGSVSELSGVGTRVYSTKYGLTTILFGGSNTEGENGLIQSTLVYKSIERRNNMVNSNGIVGQAKDTVESNKNLIG